MPDVIGHREAAAKAAVILYRRALEFYDAMEADAFMNSKQDLLGGSTPIELVAAGRANEVHAMFDRLDDGSYV